MTKRLAVLKNAPVDEAYAMMVNLGSALHGTRLKVGWAVPGKPGLTFYVVPTVEDGKSFNVYIHEREGLAQVFENEEAKIEKIEKICETCGGYDPVSGACRLLPQPIVKAPDDYCMQWILADEELDDELPGSCD